MEGEREREVDEAVRGEPHLGAAFAAPDYLPRGREESERE